MSSGATIFSFLEQFGISATLALALMCVGYIWLKGHLKKVQAQLTQFEADLNLLRASITSEEGRVITRSKQLDILRNLEEALGNHAVKCLTYHDGLTGAINDLHEIRKDIDLFMVDGRTARTETQQLVMALGTKIDGFMEQILGMLKSAMALIMGAKKSHGPE